MFSQGHFRPLTDLPPQRSPSNNTPSPSSALHTPSHTSPFDEGEDDFDLGDPHFNNSLSKSRTSSIRDRLDQHGQQGGRGNTGGGLATFVRPEDIGGLLKSLNRSEEETGHGEQDEENSPTVHAPIPTRHHPGIGLPRHSHPHGLHQQANPTMNIRKGHNRGESLDRHLSKSLNDEVFSPSSSSSSGFGKNLRLSPSPSRHHGLTALSPLQTFSPLHSTAQPLRERENHPSSNTSPERAQGSLSRKNSLTRSLSRRQSLIIHAEKWRSGEDYDWDSSADASTLFSRLTLVKAPVEGANLRRAKSSSSITPFSASSLDGPATTARGPRRSFAASSFAGFSPTSNPASLKTLPQPFSRHGPDAANRVSGLGGHEIGPQRKAMSPEEVVDIARSLMSPVVIPEGGFKGAELKRRKSAGASSYRRGSELSVSSSTSPEKPPLALEPVEYVQLDDDTLLPFVDRPAEVAELMAHASNEKLFKLLKAAFPKAPLREHWMALNPAEWNWDEFSTHLSTLTRAECPDYAWVFRARQAVRARSVALWEKLGTCLGCDGDLLNAGGEDGLPVSWGGLGLGEEGDYDPSANQVWIEGLPAMDARAEKRDAERRLKEAFGDIVEDEGEQASAGMTALLGTVGEEEEEPAGRPRQTTAQREANKRNNPVDPMTSPSFLSRSLPRDGSASRSAGSSLGGSPFTPHSPPKFVSTAPRDAERKPARSRSFVGLQILTSPQQQKEVFAKSPMALTPSINHASLPMFDRDPGNPLFPSSFSSLSVEPNLGRKASVGIGGGVKAAPEGFGRGGGRWGMGGRKQSGAGLSESAITFASESDYAHSAVDEVH